MVKCSFFFYFSVLVTLALFVASKEVVLDVSAEKTEEVFMSREQNAYPKIANKSFGKVAEFKYVGTTLKIKQACVMKLRA
jgi:Holliday junction resolvasome RuvABC ATP-dependent DNA helicase subunit